jgi:hypothetical protein
MVESTHQWSLENIEQYVEHSRIKTTIGDKKAIIQNYQGLDVENNLTGYITAYVAGEKFLCTVLCACDAKRLDFNLDTSEQVVRSLRVEY